MLIYIQYIMCIWGSFLVLHLSPCKMCIQHILILPTETGPMYSLSSGDPYPVFPILGKLWDWGERWVNAGNLPSHPRGKGTLLLEMFLFPFSLLAEPSWINALLRSVCVTSWKNNQKIPFFLLCCFSQSLHSLLSLTGELPASSLSVGT